MIGVPKCQGKSHKDPIAQFGDPQVPTLDLVCGMALQAAGGERVANVPLGLYYNLNPSYREVPLFEYLNIL